MALKQLSINPNFKLTVNFGLNLYPVSSSRAYKYPKKGRFDLYHGKDSKFYWILWATNGRIILRSTKGFENKADAVGNINKVCKLGTSIYNFENEAKNIEGMGEYFLLCDEEGNKLAISGNGKSFALAEPLPEYNIALRWQVVQNGIKKSIRSCVGNIQAIATAQKPILDYTA